MFRLYYSTLIFNAHRKYLQCLLQFDTNSRSFPMKLQGDYIRFSKFLKKSFKWRGLKNVVRVNVLDSTFLRLRPSRRFRNFLSQSCTDICFHSHDFWMLLSWTLTHFGANRHAFFLFNEYIIFDKNGPLKHTPLLW